MQAEVRFTEMSLEEAGGFLQANVKYALSVGSSDVRSWSFPLVHKPVEREDEERERLVLLKIVREGTNEFVEQWSKLGVTLNDEQVVSAAGAFLKLD